MLSGPPDLVARFHWQLKGNCVNTTTVTTLQLLQRNGRCDATKINLLDAKPQSFLQSFEQG